MTIKKAGALVFDQELQHLLLIHDRRSDKWGPPKGHLEQGETPLSGALRELKEETGLTLQVPMTADAASLPFIAIQKIRLYLFITARDQSAALSTQDSSEIKDVRWWPIADPPAGRSSNKILRVALKRVTNSSARARQYWNNTPAPTGLASNATAPCLLCQQLTERDSVLLPPSEVMIINRFRSCRRSSAEDANTRHLQGLSRRKSYMGRECDKLQPLNAV